MQRESLRFISWVKWLSKGVEPREDSVVAVGSLVGIPAKRALGMTAMVELGSG